MRSSVVVLVLSLILAAGAAASAQSPLPAEDEAAGAGVSREEAVALVVATDPRLADLGSPDGSVTLFADEGDPDLPTATTASPVVAAASPSPLPGISWGSGLVQLNANSMRLVAGDTVFTGWGPMLDIGSDPGDATYRTLEVRWVEQGVEQRVNLYLAADETHWWVDLIRTYDGSAEGDWIGYRGPLFRTPVGEPFYGDVHLVSDDGPVRGELEFDGLLLRPRFHLDFGGPDAASPAPE